MQPYYLFLLLLLQQCTCEQNVFEKHSGESFPAITPTNQSLTNGTLYEDIAFQQWTTLTLTLAIVSTLIVAVACLSFEATNVAHALLFVEQLQLLASLYHLESTRSKVQDFAAGLQWTLFELNKKPQDFSTTLSTGGDLAVHLKHRLMAACLIVTTGVFCLSALNAIRELRSPFHRGHLPAATVTSTLLITLWRVSTPGLIQAATLSYALLPQGYGFLGLGVFMVVSLPALATFTGALRWLPSSAVYEPSPWVVSSKEPHKGSNNLEAESQILDHDGTELNYNGAGEEGTKAGKTAALAKPNVPQSRLAKFFRPQGRWFSRTLMFVETFGVVFTHLRPSGTAFPLVQFLRLLCCAIVIGLPIKALKNSNSQLFILVGVTLILLVYLVYRRPFTRSVDNLVHTIVYTVQAAMFTLLIMDNYHKGINVSSIVGGLGITVPIVPLIVLLRSALQSSSILENGGVRSMKAISKWGSRRTKASNMSDRLSVHSAANTAVPSASIMFERFQVASREPLIVEVHDLLSQQQCQDLINLARPHLKPSMVDDTGNLYYDGSHRTSRGVNIELLDLNDAGKALVSDVRDQLYRAAEIVASTRGCSFELMDVIRYKTSQLFGWHVDYLSPNSDGYKEYGQRFLTTIAYLNTCEKGGETEFRVGLNIKPRMGNALIFSNFTSEGYEDPLTEHRAVPPSEGSEKWIITQWACMTQDEWVRRYSDGGIKKNPVWEEAKRMGIVEGSAMSDSTGYMTSLGTTTNMTSHMSGIHIQMPPM